MLKPGGQLVFLAFQNQCNDEAYEQLDDGKWCKYNSRRGTSPFYNAMNVEKEYRDLIKGVGFVDSHIFTESYIPQMHEDFLEGTYCLTLNINL